MQHGDDAKETNCQEQRQTFTSKHRDLQEKNVRLGEECSESKKNASAKRTTGARNLATMLTPALTEHLRHAHRCECGWIRRFARRSEERRVGKECRSRW